MEITKAIIPVAGLGTRLLPTTKAIPKEMLPVGRYPIIHHVVEELIAAGLSRLLFVTSRAKLAIENHFDDYSELMMHLEMDGNEMKEVSRFDYRKRGVEFFFTRQQVPLGQTKPLGTGDAVAAAENFTDGAPFVVAFGDSIIRSSEPVPLLRRLVESHQAHEAACTIAVYEVPRELTHQYGIVVPAPGEAGASDCQLAGILEKPAPDRAPSRLAVSARYVFGPQIFDAIRAIPPSPSGEIYLTDAILHLIQQGYMVRAVRLTPGEQRCDIGNHRAYFQTFIDYALADPQLGPGLLAYLRQVLSRHQDAGSQTAP
ncbi:MAG: NTP transferase domain-containing protein [Candidatus Latescibacteria bacterium]|nr:NTP transferase domain-containing protein [Candidatus Latescibacterota bacterium]